MLACVAVLTVSLAFLVGRDGSPGWQVLRVLGVLGVAGAAGMVLHRAGPRGQGAVLFAAGLVGLTVGVGLGVPHLTRAGASAVSVAGAACLLAGLALMVAGGRLLLSGRQWWIWVPSAALMVVLSAMTLLTWGQAVAATNVPATGIGSATPGDHGLAYTEVAVRTADGVTLSGWYVPSTNGAAVVLRHGAGSTRSDVLAHGVVLAREGYGVLMLDARGHGRSGGRAMDFGWFGDQDVRAGVDFVLAQPDVADGRVGVVGLSMGGEEAIGAAAGDDRIRAVVAEGAGQRVAPDKSWMPQVYGVRGRVQQILDQVTFTAADLLSSADPPVPLRQAAGAAAPRPMLLIAAGARPDEGHAARDIQQGAPGSVTVWVVPGAGHIGGLATDPHAWERRVVGFLEVHLVGG